MPSKTEQFAADPIHAHAKAVRDALDRLAPDAAPPTAEPTLTRARKFVARLTDLLAVVDPDLLDFSLIPQTAQHLTNLPSWIDSYTSGSDDSASIEQHLDVVARVLPGLSAAAPLVANGKASAIVASVKRETESLFEGVQKQVAGVQARVDTATIAAEAVKDGHSALIAKNTQIEEANQRAATEFRSLLETEKAAAFDRFHTDVEGKLAQLATDSAKQTASAAAASLEQNASAESILHSMRTLEEEVKVTAASIGDRVLVGDYGTHAENERATADKLRMWAGGAFAVGAAFAIWASVAASREPGITWQRLVAKLATTVIFAGLGGYLAAQSAEHRHEERKVRRRFLNLKALGPFIALLPDAKQEEIRNTLAQRAFFESEPPPSQRAPKRGLSVDDFTKVLSAVRDLPKL